MCLKADVSSNGELALAIGGRAFAEPVQASARSCPRLILISIETGTAQTVLPGSIGCHCGGGISLATPPTYGISTDGTFTEPSAFW